MWPNLIIFAIPILTQMSHFPFRISDSISEITPSDSTSPSFFSENESGLRLKALREFRALVPDIISEDEYYANDHLLIRYLKARDFNLDAANKMIRECTHWRRKNRIDTILNETIFEFPSGSEPIKFAGQDKEGRPIVVILPKKVDLRRMIASGRREKFLRYVDQQLEKGYQVIKNTKTLMKTTREPVTQFVSIIDFDGLNVRQHMCFGCVQFFMDCVYHFENYYPTAVKYIVLINVNRVALAVGDFIRPAMSTSSREALRYFGTNKTEWSQFLNSIISPDQLPGQLGGTTTKY